jgi:hypothetical protein
MKVKKGSTGIPRSERFSEHTRQLPVGFKEMALVLMNSAPVLLLTFFLLHRC